MNPKSLLYFIIIFTFIGSIIGFVIGKKNEKYRDSFNIFMTGVTFAATIMLYKYISNGFIEIYVPNIMGTGLHFRLDLFRYIFVLITVFIWFLTTIYSTQYLISYKNRNRYYLFFMLTLWSTIGIFISQNLINLFTFFEIMSFTSYALVIHDEDEYAHEAGNTYIIMAISGGLILLMGLFMIYDYTHTLDILELKSVIKNIGNIKYFIVSLIIIGFGVKAGMVPLHIWLPKAHPAAPAPASAVLSGILLKTGIFGIMVTLNIIMDGDFVISVVILILGFINMFIGGFLAMFQRNIKRILAYSSMSQIGYILIGVGLIGMLKGNESVAIYGTIYYIINHAIFKVLLFMGAGTIYMGVHELSINNIGGFGRKKYILKIIFFIGLCAIIGMPGFNGFASKMLLHQALSEAHRLYGGFLFEIAEIIFTLSSAFTVAYLLKIFMAVFIEESNHKFSKDKVEINGRAIIPMTMLACLIIYIGINPYKILNILYKIGEEINIKGVQFQCYSKENIKTSIITILIGVLIYIKFIRKYLKKGIKKNWYYENISLNWYSLENNFYKPLTNLMFKYTSMVFKVIDNSIIHLINGILKIVNTVDNFCSIKQKSVKFATKLNTAMYSVFVVGVVLVVSLTIFILKI